MGEWAFENDVYLLGKLNKSHNFINKKWKNKKIYPQISIIAGKPNEKHTKFIFYLPFSVQSSHLQFM